MVDLLPSFGQALAPLFGAVVPTGYTGTLLGWLAAYVAMLFTWALTSTHVTMEARRTAGRSVLVRWASAVIGVLVFVIVPAFSARLLLPSAVLLAVVPVGYYFLRTSRRVGTEVVRGVVSGTGYTGFFTYRVLLRLATTIAEIVWMALQAILRFDWAKLRQVPALTREAWQRIRQPAGAAPGQELVLLQESGLPLDLDEDPRFKSFPKSIKQRFMGLLGEAAAATATDITMTAGQSGTQIQYRIDGDQVAGPAMSDEEILLVARLAKVLAGLNPAPVTQPQEGVIPTLCGPQRCDLFVTSAPSSGRETLTIRLTADERRLIDTGLAGLGIDDAALAAARALLEGREGLVLFVGRPDSGKGTSIYGAIRELVTGGKSVATVESSLRHRLDHVPQVRFGDADAGRFAKAIEASLRHDPDVLVVRDLFDRQSVELCMRTAVAGRLVIAGLRADDSTDVLRRLAALGVDRGLMKLALKGIVAQRLARTLCDSCKTSYQPTAELVGKLGLRPKGNLDFHREVGCPKCRGTGFKGRSGLFEVLVMNDAVQDALSTDPALQSSREVVRKSLARSLQQSAVAKVCHGITSVQEISRILK
jgi:type II secretory ATPase GspE/PulE/Tfp pilus assembly ATPase PilB-like protein